MSQINKYPNRAAYEADNSRLKTQSAVSYVEDDGEVIYVGVFVVVGFVVVVVCVLAVFVLFVCTPASWRSSTRRTGR